jgi:hypothetical protein
MGHSTEFVNAINSVIIQFYAFAGVQNHGTREAVYTNFISSLAEFFTRIVSTEKAHV